MTETQENWITHQHGKAQSQREQKILMVVISNWKDRQAIHKEMEKGMLVNECFLCQAEIPGHRVDSHP